MQYPAVTRELWSWPIPSHPTCAHTVEGDDNLRVGKVGLLLPGRRLIGRVRVPVVLPVPRLAFWPPFLALFGPGLLGLRPSVFLVPSPRLRLGVSLALLWLRLRAPLLALLGRGGWLFGSLRFRLRLRMCQQPWSSPMPILLRQRASHAP
jgi:hypothetical protein